MKTLSPTLKSAILRLAREDRDFREALASELRVGGPLTIPRKLYLPSEVRDTDPIVPPGTDLEIWKYESNGVPYGIAFAGKANKPLFHFRFRSEEARERQIEKAIRDRKGILDRKQERKDEKKNFQHGLKEGDILYSSWGYDQTNVDFYQVVSTVGKAIVMREIASKSAGGDRVVAAPDRFIGPPIRKIPQGDRNHVYVRINSFSSAYPWDGKSLYQTGPHGGH